MKTLFTDEFVSYLNAKAVTDAAGHAHDEGTGQFTGSGGTPKTSQEDIEKALKKVPTNAESIRKEKQHKRNLKMARRVAAWRKRTDGR